MKKNYLLYFLLLALSTPIWVSCNDWTESEAKDYFEGPSEEYYAALRAYKKSDHPKAFGWFGNWTGEGASLVNSMAGIPDSVDVVSIWGNWSNITQAQKKDLKFCQEVKGTRFHIKQTDAEKNEITLFRGKIEFNVESTGQKTVMKPLQRVIYNPRNAEMRVEQITNIKWENGKYNFTDIPLQELISIINQMYNSDVTLAKGINHESAFTGSIRYDEPLEDVVNKICFTLNLNKEEHANKIIIKK